MTGAGVAHKTRAVLVVEDDPEMRALLRDYPERDGFEVVEEASAERVVPLVQIASFDVAIIDKEMPGMGGLDLLSFLRGRCPHMPVIVITAFGGPVVAEEAFARGACRYLEKPFRISDLVAALRTLTAPFGGDDPDPP